MCTFTQGSQLCASNVPAPGLSAAGRSCNSAIAALAEGVSEAHHVGAVAREECTGAAGFSPHGGAVEVCCEAVTNHLAVYERPQEGPRTWQGVDQLGKVF